MFSVTTLATIRLNTPWILSSRALSLTDSGMFEISRNSLLEYCSLAQHFCSVTTKPTPINTELLELKTKFTKRESDLTISRNVNVKLMDVPLTLHLRFGIL